MAAPDLTKRSVCFVGKWGTDDAGYNPVGAPMARLTIAAALADLAANYPTATAAAPHVVSIEPGTYLTPAFALPPFTFLTKTHDGVTNPADDVIILLLGNITLAAGWAANQTASGGLNNLTIRQNTSQAIDFTLPAPTSGTPVRTLELRNVRTSVDLVNWQATGANDRLILRAVEQDGTSGDAVTLSGGTVMIQNLLSAAIVTLQDTATIALDSQAYGINLTSSAGALLTASTGAGSAIRLGGCDTRALTINEVAPGSILVYADAPSIPLTANITYLGTATSANLIPTNESGSGPAPSNSNGGAAVTNNSGNTTVNANASNYQVALTVGGVARTSIIILGTGAPPTTGDMINFSATFPITAAVIITFRNATAGGTLLYTFTGDGASAYTAILQFLYLGGAWTLFTADLRPV